MSSSLGRILNPWKYRREQAAAQIAALRKRDGDHCFRCKRPMQFGLPEGHDRGARIEMINPDAGAEAEQLDNLCLTHGRCAASGDDTSEVRERVRIKNEAALFERARERRRA